MGEGEEARELVILLRAIVEQQERKIAQLQGDIRIWESKYKESLFGEGGGTKPKKEMCLQELKKGLSMIEEQFRGTALGESIQQAAVVAEDKLADATVKLVSSLCSKVQGAQQEVCRQGQIIQEQTMMLEQKAMESRQLNSRIDQEARKATSEGRRAEQEQRRAYELQSRIEAFQREFEKAKEQASQYQDRLLAEVKRLQGRSSKY